MTTLTYTHARRDRPVPTLRPRIRSHLIGAGLLTLIAFGGFGSWAVTAPIASTVIAPGSLTVATERLDLAHREGGLIAEVFVREGQTVRQGDLLIRLDDVDSRAALGEWQDRRRMALAQRARLVAERDGLIAMPEVPELAGDAEAADVLMSEARLFSERREAFLAEMALIEAERAEAQARAAQAAARSDSLREQLALMESDLEATRTLIEKGLATRSRLTQLQRGVADASGMIAVLAAEAQAASKAIEAIALRRAKLQQARVSEAAARLTEVEATLLQANRRLAPGEDRQARRDLRAPVDGVVHAVAFPAAGSVAGAGARLLTLIPLDSRMEVEARVSPTDIDRLSEGQAARLRLTGLPARTTPEIAGRIVAIAPDVTTDPRSGQAWYAARLAIEDPEFDRLQGEARLAAGMPVEVFVAQGTRTLFDYVSQPVTDAIARSFRE
ncbi:hypothetical protein ATO6_22315 [Oceanicola sp. 22II-s10i]|uniref:HlyD family type I secretion periplasmic adaptor subunit n=1 Tax=Oceanicola sp. 22II-s10i TaxID=1317116 RepID=UPI000B5272B7|nr:HlyD family type I secretion periplasmic adaptor subunit [Oceanicola sp. 22II-s10i]OWU82354.1 hypothetical protein ATO6_22315 [Oceanicola sp. 22II-s10i]